MVLLLLWLMRMLILVLLVTYITMLMLLLSDCITQPSVMSFTMYSAELYIPTTLTLMLVLTTVRTESQIPQPEPLFRRSLEIWTSEGVVTEGLWSLTK